MGIEKYRHEICEAIFDNTGGLSCGRDPEICAAAADTGEHLRDGDPVHSSYDGADKAGCSPGYGQVPDRDNAGHVHSGRSGSDGELGRSQAYPAACCDHYRRHQHHRHGGDRTAFAVRHQNRKEAR